MAENETLETRPGIKRTHRWAFPLGLGIALLAIIGAITLISFGVSGVKRVADKTKLKTEYAIFIKNVIRNDPSPFDDISTANVPQLLDCAIWDLVGNGDIEAGKYEYSESDPIGYRIPQEDIELSFARLFGNEIKPQHDTVLGAGYTFYYDAVTKEYTIPVTGVSPIYVPKVYTIDKKGRSIILTVGFVGYGEWDTNDLGWNTDPEPIKYMKITLRERKSDNKDIPPYYVGALQATDALEVAVETNKDSLTTQALPITQPEITQPKTTQTDETSDDDQTDENGSTAESDKNTD